MQCRIGEIQIEGNKITRSYIIVRELPFHPGDSIDNIGLPDRLEKGRGQLINLNLFNQVNITHQYYDSVGTCWIRVHIVLVEKWYLWPIPFVSIADRNPNQWKESGYDLSRLNYGLYLFRYNARGINHTIKASFVNGYSRQLGLEYRVPYWDKKKHFGSVFAASFRHNNELAYGTIENKLAFYRNEKEDALKALYLLAGLQFRPGFFSTHSLWFDFENVSVSDSVVVLGRNPDYLGKGSKSSAVFLSYEWLHRVLNNKNYPTKGYQVLLSVEGGKMKSQKTQSLLRVTSEMAKYQKLKKRIYAAYAFGGFLRFTNSKSFRYTPAMGYEYFVRGYEPYVIFGNTMLLGKSSLRFALLDERLYPVEFIPLKNYRKAAVSSFINLNFDIGYVRNENPVDKGKLANTLLLGGGIGWDWVFYFDKVLRFEYSMNHLGQHGLYIQFTKPF